MAIPILFLYTIGLVLFIIGLDDEDDIKKLIYFGLSFFISVMGYYLSYRDPDYLQAAYMPLVLSIFGLIMLFKTAWEMLPHGQTWDKQAESEGD